MIAAPAVEPVTNTAPINESTVAVSPESVVTPPPSFPKKKLPAYAERQSRTSTSAASSKKKRSAVVRSNRDNGERKMSESPTKTTQFGKLSLTLSTSLTISRNAPGVPLSAPESADAVQEELIAREKTLGELNAQIVEMKEVIKALQGRLGIQPASAVTAGEISSELGASAVALAATEVLEQPEIAVKVPVVAAPIVESELGLTERRWFKPMVGGLLIAVALGLAVFWYRRRQEAYHWYEGPFDETDDGIAENNGVDAGDVQQTGAVQSRDVGSTSGKQQVVDVGSISGKMAKNSDVGSVSGKRAVMSELLGETSVKMPAYQKQKLESNVPPEYDMLEEADVYLRFGHDKLAEEVLLEAIQVNPNNPHAYLTLLGIYASREDSTAFFTWAQKVKVLGDAKAWKEAAEIGHKLEPANPFYH